jgi:hypothetical protein
MPGLVPGIHVFLRRISKQLVDGRDKPGHDEGGGLFDPAATDCTLPLGMPGPRAGPTA